MSEISLTLTEKKAEHDAVCAWCESPYTRKSYNGLYCSDECRSEVNAGRSVERYRRDYTYIENKTPKRYADYESTGLRDSVYQVTPPEGKVKATMKPIQVPTINFRRFNESKNVIVLTTKVEQQRSSWHESR